MHALDIIRRIAQAHAPARVTPAPAAEPPTSQAPTSQAPTSPTRPAAPEGMLLELAAPDLRAVWGRPAAGERLGDALNRGVKFLFGDAPPSPKRAAAAGWTKTGGLTGGWGKVGATWEHTSGWRAEHCGHPTANYPWSLFSPAGRHVGTGAVFAEPPNPDLGRNWPNLAMLMAYVTLLAPPEDDRSAEEPAPPSSRRYRDTAHRLTEAASARNIGVDVFGPDHLVILRHPIATKTVQEAHLVAGTLPYVRIHATRRQPGGRAIVSTGVLDLGEPAPRRT